MENEIWELHWKGKFYINKNLNFGLFHTKFQQPEEILQYLTPIYNILQYLTYDSYNI